MCLNLIGSKFQNIKEVELLLNRKTLILTEKDIIAIKDDREAIEKELQATKQLEEITALCC